MLTLQTAEEFRVRNISRRRHLDQAWSRARMYAGRTDFDPKREKYKLSKKHESAWRVVGVLQAREFTFKNVLCDRSAGTG